MVQTEAATEPADIEEEPLDPKAPKSPKNSWAEMRTARYRAEAEAKFLREQLAERKAAPLPAAAPEPEPAVIDPREPKSEDFDTHDDYLRARDKFNRLVWREEQAAEQRQSDEAKTVKAAEEKSAKRKEDWESRESIVKVKHGDYDAHFESFLKVAQTNRPLASAVFNSKFGPDLAQQLGAAGVELTRIAALEPEEILKEIGVLEHTLQEKEKVQPAITQAPRPLAAVSGPASRPAKATSMEDRLYPD